MGSRRTILITGTSRGLGTMLATSFLERGDFVYGCSRSANPIDHPDYKHFGLDLTDDASVKRMFAEIAHAGTGLQLLINNAGVDQASLAVLTGVAEAEQLLKTNVLAAFLVTREAIKLMKRRRFGRILFFSSINVRLGSAGSALYNASKAALEALALSLGRECSMEDITINSLGLSLVAGTGMAAALSPIAEAAKKGALAKPQPLEIDDILHAIDFFAAPESRYITGQTLYFGGL